MTRPLAPARHRRRTRTTAAMALITAIGLIAFTSGLAQGDYPLSLGQVAGVLTGGGSPLERMVVLEWRLARSLVALAVGLALGVAGALTQSLARNPLASPDVLGIGMGASAAAVTGIALGATGVVLPAAALVGALAATCLILLISHTPGDGDAPGAGVGTERTVLVGIGVNAMLASVVTFVLVAADLDTAAQATVWLTGTVNGRGMAELIPLTVMLVVVAAALIPQARELGPLLLGPGLAGALGVRVGRRRLGLLACAVILTAGAVAAAGPIAFVALVAPQLAVRLMGGPRPPLVASALVGGVLVLAADLAARTLLPVELPVGVATAAFGGPFLLALLVRERRRLLR